MKRPLVPVVVNYGLGADSTAWLIRLMAALPWRPILGDAAVRERIGLPADADLDDLLVITAMTGSEHPETARLVTEHMEKLRWGVYEVRRGFKAAAPKDGSRVDPFRRGFSARETVRLASGTRDAMQAALEGFAVGRGAEVDRTDVLHPRVWLQRRAEVYPTRERFLVAVPAFVAEKRGNGFEGAWTAGEFEPEVPQQIGLVGV